MVFLCGLIIGWAARYLVDTLEGRFTAKQVLAEKNSAAADVLDSLAVVAKSQKLNCIPVDMFVGMAQHFRKRGVDGRLGQGSEALRDRSRDA